MNVPNSLVLIDRDALGTFEATTSREWLVTNGIGGYASGTLSGCNTRRYHGLLVASLRPPVDRVVTVAHLEVAARYYNKTYALSCNEYADGTIDPLGFVQLQSFRLEGTLPVWTWLLGDALIEQRVWMARGANTTYVTFTALRATDSIDLELNPLCTYRDYHSQNRGARDIYVTEVANGVRIDSFWGAQPFRILIDSGEHTITRDWYWNFKHRVETERGLDDIEDLFQPTQLRATLRVGETITLIFTAEDAQPLAANESLRQERARQIELVKNATVAKNAGDSTTTAHGDLFVQLVLAADQFIVDRHNAEGSNLGKTVIAGYPWFSDWGRDTMIALPGLTLATRRFADAASILRTFAKFVSEGMLPNRFPDAGEAPEYNTVDATLWYFVAIDQYFARTNDRQLIKELFPVLSDIIEWHVRGTRFGIHVDSQDGLLFAGEPGVQLTWMDAKVGEHVITARIGKPVEINALWFNALKSMQQFARLLRDTSSAQHYEDLANRVFSNFNQQYWSESSGHLCDVIHGPEGELRGDGKRYDTSLRPNQLIAVSLRYPLLDDERARAVVDVCARELWTPVGLRSLGRYKGSSLVQLNNQERATPLPNPLHWERGSETTPPPVGRSRDARERVLEIAEQLPRSHEVRERDLEPNYVGRYVGGPSERDAVYHQGTVWGWLLGPFVSAHYRVYRDSTLALSYLDGVHAHLREACIGQISEIFDGDAPFTPRGCFAQAWSVSEILRAWSAINENEHQTRLGKNNLEPRHATR